MDYVILQYIFSEKNLHMGGPAQFKPMLFKGPLCVYMYVCVYIYIYIYIYTQQYIFEPLKAIKF